MASQRSSIDSCKSPPYPQWDISNLDQTSANPHPPTERADQRNPVNNFEPIGPQTIMPQSAPSHTFQTQYNIALRHSTSAPDLGSQRRNQITPNHSNRSPSLPLSFPEITDLQPPTRNPFSQLGPAFHQPISRRNSSAVYSSSSIRAVTPTNPLSSVADNISTYSRHELYASATSTTSTTPLPPTPHARRETGDPFGFDDPASNSVRFLPSTVSDLGPRIPEVQESESPNQSPEYIHAREDGIFPISRSPATRSDPGLRQREWDLDHLPILTPTQQRSRSESPENLQAREERMQRSSLPLATRGDPRCTHYQRDLNRIAGLTQPGLAQPAQQAAILPSYATVNPSQGDGGSRRRCAGVCDMLSDFIFFLRHLGGWGILWGFLCALAIVMVLVYFGIYQGMFLSETGSDG